MKIETVSQKCDVPTATLRYWEKIGLLPPIARNASGYRDYQDRDLNWVFYVKALRKAGMEIQKLKVFIDDYRASVDRTRRKQILIDQATEIKRQQEEIQQTLNYLTYKIDNFDDHMIGYEEEKLAYFDQNTQGEN
ncbi:MerR family transcriptional regulator [Fructobacillus ficulneus]|uniref:Transcriptional regulator, MerR family n=1 Tax=Fructobacillus ficulneus TaxID=157463 RepID=A0A0K8MG28_9LACO|nr:MerR family transcriptional regulator [Fructobacillus ficulneus]GAO99481.1 transcriptional regulator, MerR family [Fructobacillus ficulneus]